MKQFPLKINPRMPTMLFQNGQVISTAATPSHAIEIMQRFNSHEAAQRLAEAVDQIIPCLYDLRGCIAEKSALRAALAEWEAVK